MGRNQISSGIRPVLIVENLVIVAATQDHDAAQESGNDIRGEFVSCGAGTVIGIETDDVVMRGAKRLQDFAAGQGISNHQIEKIPCAEIVVANCVERRPGRNQDVVSERVVGRVEGHLVVAGVEKPKERLVSLSASPSLICGCCSQQQPPH